MRFLATLIMYFVVAGNSKGFVVQAARTDQRTGPSCSLSLKGPDQAVPAGSPVPLDVVATNTSSQDIYFEDVPAIEWNYRIGVYDNAGRRMALKSIPEEKQHVPFKLKTVVLKPGQQWKQEIRLGEFYDLSQPGLYTVKVSGIGQANVDSNSIQIDVAAVPTGAVPQAGFGGSQVFDLGIVGPASLKVGSPFQLRVGLRNVSQQEIVIQHKKDGKAEFEYFVEVTDVHGMPVPKTEYGKSLAEHKAALSPIGWQDVRLQPEQVLTDRIVITDLFELNQPGEYLISVSRRDEISSWNRISSRPRLVTIVP